MKIVADLQRDIRGSPRTRSCAFSGNYFIYADYLVASTLSNPQRCNAIFNRVISAGARYRLAYMFPEFVCGRYSFECPRLLSRPFLPRAGGDLFYYLQLVSAATSYTQRRSATCARVSAKNTAPVLPWFNYSPVFQALHVGRTVLKTCTRILASPRL